METSKRKVDISNELKIKPGPQLSSEEQHERVQQMRALIEGSTELTKFRQDDIWLRRWLGISDWDVTYALRRYKKYHHFRLQKPEWFYQYPPQQYENVLRREHGCLLDGKDKFGRPVYFMDASKMNPEKSTLDDQCVLDSLWMEGVMDDPETIKNGIVIVLDAKGASWKVVKWYPPRHISAISTFAETAPLRNLEVNVINTSKGFNVMIKCIFPLFNSFIKDRFFFHFNDHESLSNRLGKEVLPPHLGGKGPALNYDKAIEKLYKRLEEVKMESEQL